MNDELYRQFDTARLIQVVEKQLATPSQSQEFLARREQALRVLTEYPDKNHEGKPLPPDAKDENRYIEVDVTSDEADRLKIKGKRISVRGLLTIITADVTANTSEEMMRRGCAALLLSSGVKHFDAWSRAETRYREAEDAYRILSSPIGQPRANISSPEGREILDLLKRTPRSKIALTEQEYKSLSDGDFNVFDKALLSVEEQRQRFYINKCVEVSHEKPHHNLPFNAILDPARLSRVKDIMRRDETARWLLDSIEKEKIPVILHRYNVPDSELERLGYLTLGTELDVKASAQRSIDVQFLRVFVNLVNDVDIAVTAAHEARHWWKKYKDMIKAAPLSMERIVWNMVDEADSVAIDSKIQWGIKSKSGATGNQSRDYIDFERYLSEGSNGGLPSTEKQKKAMQGIFIQFLEKEFASPRYLKDFIAFEVEHNNLQFSNANMARRVIEQSKVLTSDFLKGVSQLEKNDFYLDDEAIHRIRGIFLDKLPDTINTYMTGVRPGKKPFPI